MKDSIRMNGKVSQMLDMVVTNQRGKGAGEDYYPFLQIEYCAYELNCMHRVNGLMRTPPGGADQKQPGTSVRIPCKQHTKAS